MDNDIGHVLRNWPYDPDDDLIIRIVETNEGPKHQMRIDMGIIQMEIDGHPTGVKPENFDSWSMIISLFQAMTSKNCAVREYSITTAISVS